MKYRWSIAPETPLLDLSASRIPETSVPLVARCLGHRGVREPAAAARYLHPRLRDLADPFRLPGMDRAVDRLLAARERGEAVTLFGDYDVDGITATALLQDALGRLGWTLRSYLPDRFGEGYGLTPEAARNCLAQQHTPLLLAVDCGSTAIEAIDWLRAQGVEVLVLDHHQVGPQPPAAVALVNPQLGPTDRELCSVGLAFKLVHAVVKEGRTRLGPPFADFDLRPLLDLVALGTVADLVPLTGENRILVRHGLERLGSTDRPGLVALKELAGVEGEINPGHVGFQLGPRLNAAGRLETAGQALDLLLADAEEPARRLAAALDAVNRERQAIERRMAEDAIGMVRSRFDPGRDYVIVEGQLQWHIGVVGIVASRVLREFHRPTLIIGGDGPVWRGSGRSIRGFDLAAALRECDDLLVRHGGHAMAAGITLDPGRMEALRERLNDLARRRLTPADLVPEIRLDAVAAVAELSLDCLAALAALA
ncbi:MAG: single-stranded-DNA-specific exonuclease RecJ, partial [Verrucomicrobiota bacterium]